MIFNSYVKLPEGIPSGYQITRRYQTYISGPFDINREADIIRPFTPCVVECHFDPGQGKPSEQTPALFKLGSIFTLW